MASKAKRRISPEGLIAALEQLAFIMLKQQEAEQPATHKKKKHPMQLGGLEETDDGIKVTNVAGVVFALTHPWVAVHNSAANQCDNPPKMHEGEYEYMLEMAEMLIDARGSSRD